MTNFWTQIVAALTAYVAAHFGQWGAIFADLFAKWFGGAAQNEPDPDIIRVGSKVGAAPPDVIAALKGVITDLVTKALANRPVISRIVLAIVANIPDSFFNGLWDSIFMAKIAAGEMTAKKVGLAGFDATHAAAIAPLSASDLAACKAEAGIAA